MKYQCIFSDIDGTLLNSHHQITSKTKEKIKNLHEQGIPFILVSARMPKGIRFLQEELEINDPIICYSGGLVLDNDQILFSQGIQKQTANQLLEYLQKHHQICTTIYFNDHWMVNDIKDPWVIQESEITGIVPETINFNQIPFVHKVLCMGESHAISDLEQQLLQLFPSLSIYKSKETYLEIMDGTISKSQAIKKICQKNHYSLEKTISFGDNYNDIDMLKTTKLGFAMQNAPIGVLHEIKTHTLSNDEDGIVYALEHLVGD